jgi:diaminopimelate epimerase
MIPFLKMHGCGNDFLVVRESDLCPATAAAAGAEPIWQVDPADLARRACDRHFGVGADGLLVYGPRPAREGLARLRMFYWNADGSRAEMCGNGARCVVRAAVERGEAASPLVLETDAGDRPARIRGGGSTMVVEIDMGPAAWEPAAVPVRAGAAVVAEPLVVGTSTLEVTALSMGNPHAVVFVPDRLALVQIRIESLGRELAEHAAFPRGANASFVAVEAGALHVRVWERGAGATLACGTAACAVLAAARRTGRIAAASARVHLPGGAVEARADDREHFWLAGPAARVAEGTLSEEMLPHHS